MTEKKDFHPKNRHNQQYDFEKLISCYRELERFVAPNKYGKLSIDFFNPEAVKALNRALLICYYNLQYWDIPKNNLCPPIPGRADYIHYVAELLQESGKGQEVRCIDIGVGANCIYPIIGIAEYGWRFVGTDVSRRSLSNAEKIVMSNKVLKGKIELREQSDVRNIFKGVVGCDEYFDLSICNPPFHSSAAEAADGSLRKLSNLKGKKVKEVSLNFGGVDGELWCDGGELKFIITMIKESRMFAKNIGWFTVLVSKEDNLKKLVPKLQESNVREYKIIDMRQGNKVSRILAWQF